MFFSSFLSLGQSGLPMSDGRLNGEYSNFDNQNSLTTSGEFKNNLRVGEWTVKDSSEKIIYKRNYKSIYSYTETRFSGSVAGGSQKLYPLKRSNTNLYQYPEYENILWTKRVWSILPEKDHRQLYSQETLIRINEWIKNGTINVYEDDELSKVIETQDIDLDNSNCTGVTMKKDYFFDEDLGIMLEKIVELTFYVENIDNEKLQTFSLFYPTDGRKLLSSFNISHKSEKIKHYDDLFFFQDYSEVIYNEANAKGIKIEPDFANIEKYQQTSNEIKQIIISTEHRLWLTH